MQAASLSLGSCAQQALTNRYNNAANGVKVRGSCIRCRVHGSGPDNSMPGGISVAPLSTSVVRGSRPAQRRSRRGLVSVASFQDTYGGVYEDEGPGSVGWGPFTSERFQFRELLGKGGWGTVHLALDTETGQQVAIKSQTKWRRQEAGKKSPSQEVVLQRIRNEGDLLQYMQRSQRVVKLLHRMEDRDNAYIITEVLEGGDLESAFNGRHHFSEPYAAMLIREVLLFLRDCHNSRICFSDAKPANFMLTEDEEGRPMVKAIDFGCAQVYTPGAEPLQNRRGTPVYFSPEMFQRCYGLGADVWGAGVMLYRFLSGRFPWFGNDDAPKKISPARIQGAVLAMPITFDGAPWTFKSESAVSLVKGMLARDPQLRLTVDEALRHPWLTKFCPDEDEDEPCVVADEDEVEEIRQQLRNNVVPAPNFPPVTSTSNVKSSSLKEPLPAL